MFRFWVIFKFLVYFGILNFTFLRRFRTHNPFLFPYDYSVHLFVTWSLRHADASISEGIFNRFGLTSDGGRLPYLETIPELVLVRLIIIIFQYELMRKVYLFRFDILRGIQAEFSKILCLCLLRRYL